MKFVVPNLSNLQPNPAWASLPLFDRTGWKRVAFGAFAESIGDRAEPKDAQEEIDVGLEHLDPQCLHIRRWWKGSDVTGAELQKTPASNPVRRAFELRPHHGASALAHGKPSHGAPALAHGKPSHDQATVLLAVRGAQPELWDVIEKGRMVFDSDGHCEWSRNWAKAHRYVKIKGSPKVLTETIGQLMAAPPAQR